MLFPIGDDNRRRRRVPVVMPLLVAANLAVWLLQLARGDAFTMAWATVPWEISHGADLVGRVWLRVGDQVLPLDHAAGPRPVHLTLLSAMFLHGGWGHLFGNLLYLVIFGDQIEDELGRVRFLLFYVACGVAAGLAQVWWDPQSVVPCVGASGAIAGVLGAYLIRHPTNPVHVLILFSVVTFPAWLVLGLWIGLQIVSQAGTPAGTATGVAYLAHIGGFLAGVALALLLGRRREERG